MINMNEFKEWLETQPNSNYFMNVKNLMKVDAISEKQFPLFVSAVSIFIKNDAVAKIPKKPSDWFGTEGEKIVHVVTYQGCASFETMYGWSYIHRMVDDDGNVFVWRTSNGGDFVNGDKYEIKGTIKKHDEYKEIKQTNLLRVKIIKEIENESE